MLLDMVFHVEGECNFGLNWQFKTCFVSYLSNCTSLLQFQIFAFLLYFVYLLYSQERLRAAIFGMEETIQQIVN